MPKSYKFFQAIAILFTLIISWFTWQIPSAFAAAEPETSLRALAEKRGILIGAAVDMKALKSDPKYGEVLAREFNAILPENAMKLILLHPERDRYNFTDTDILMEFAKSHQMQVHGHPLIWHYAIPQWLESGNFTREQFIEILHDYIKTVVTRYRGQIKVWYVVNESINRDGSLEDSIWLRKIGPEYIDLAYRWVHELDPEARLFYNEYSAEEVGQKADAVYQLLQGLIQRGVPIHGVGLQMHKDVDWSSAPQLIENMKKLAALGLDLSITEMDIYIKEGFGNQQQALEKQAQIYGDTLQACLSIPQCVYFSIWGFSDRYTWASSWRGSQGAPLIFDEQYRPKPAYYAMQEVLSR